MKISKFIELVGDGRLFSVTFEKKDGTLRRLTGRLGVKQGLVGTGMRFDPVARNMVPVFDVQKREFRMVNGSTIREIRARGKVLSIDSEG